MRTFNYVSTFSLIVNVIIVPFFGFVYMALFVITLLSCIMPFLGWALYIPELCFVGIDYVTGMVASIPYSTIPVKELFVVELFLWAVAMFAISDKCIINKKVKPIISTTCVGIAVLMLILNMLL